MALTPAQLLAHDVMDRLSPVITDVVVCPGSRNSPLLLDIIARENLRVHVRIDERSAAFLALGIARVQRRPVPVVTTSGSAVSNCLPAVVEAASAHIPLIVLSADRPGSLQGSGASQTINQVGIFSSFAHTVQINSVADVDAIDAALSATKSSSPMHFNLALDTPLLDAELPTITASPAKAITWSAHWLDHGEIDLDLTLNTLVIAGDEAWEVAGLEDVPTIAEPTAPTPFHPVHPLAAQFLAKENIAADGYVINPRPEQIVVVGHPTLHREVMELLQIPEIDLYVLSRTPTLTDPFKRAKATGTRVKVHGQPSKQWLKICGSVDGLAADQVRTTLSDPRFGFTGLHVAAAIADSLGTTDTVFSASSNAIRDLSVVGLPFYGVETYSPRGAAGIDGNVSQAIGTALAVQRRYPDQTRAPRTVALLGDLAFLHDVGGLLIGPSERMPENLVMVVSNDNGGGIFEALETGAPELKENFDRVFGTPHEVSIDQLCAAYNIEYRGVSDLSELTEVLAESVDMPSFLVVEAHTTRKTRREMSQEMVVKVQ